MKKIGITWGDQAGIGPEVIKKALATNKWEQQAELITIGQLVDATPGQPTLQTAQASKDALLEAAAMLRDNVIDGLVTAPVSKEWLHKVGFDYPGQTEFFAHQLNCNNFAMCLTGQHLTVALVTIHVAIDTVPSLLKQEEITRIGLLLEKFCRKRRSRVPKIAVCGLNPHAGESGAFGKEDLQIITPAIEQLNKHFEQEVIFSGPHPPDTIFRPAADGLYDAVLCMYHDQGLIPLKLLDFQSGVNTTLGLPYPRTSPDHGTAFGIAGKNIADPTSMIHAIDLAVALS